jgi:hypothetical protein
MGEKNSRKESRRFTKRALASLAREGEGEQAVDGRPWPGTGERLNRGWARLGSREKEPRMNADERGWGRRIAAKRRKGAQR